MSFGDQSAREDLRQLVDEVMVENMRLRQRLNQVESKLQEGDMRFSTPESQKETSDTQRKDAADPQTGGQRQEAADPQRKDHGEVGGDSERKEAADPHKERNSRSSEEPAQEQNAAFTEKSIEFMKLMMDSMREMQKRMAESKEESGMIRGVEGHQVGLTRFAGLATLGATAWAFDLG